MGATFEMFHCLADAINFMYSLTGLAILVLGLVLIFYPWGETNPGFFFTGGVVFVLFSFCVLSISWLGSLAYKYKDFSYGNYHQMFLFTANIYIFNNIHVRIHLGCLNGKRILGIYFSFLVALLCAEIYFVNLGMQFIGELTGAAMVMKKLRLGEAAKPGYFESHLLQSFNAIFFGAARAYLCRGMHAVILMYCPACIFYKNI